MGYKYMVAEATTPARSNSRNIFVIVVNAFFYSSMFTVVECMAFREMTTLFVMIYVASFAFFMCSYVSIKRAQPVKRRRTASDDSLSLDVDSDWRHIVKRTAAYGKELRDQFEDALDKSGDTFSGLIDELRKKIVPDYSEGRNENDEIKDELDEYRQQITLIAAKEDLDDNELEILGRINKAFDEIYFDFYRGGDKPVLEYEARISELSNDIEMLKNTINVRKAREEEERLKQSQQSKRSQAQQARRKREREERERKEREEREAEEARQNRRRKTKSSEEDVEEELKREYEKAVEEEKRRREEERKRQEKRRRERNKRSTGTAGRNTGAGSGTGPDTGNAGSGGTGRNSNKAGDNTGNDSGANGRTGRNTGERNSQSRQNNSKDNDSTVAGVETKYFKGCTNSDELSLRYKKLCLIYHPDSGNGDVDTYIELKDEYELLKKRLS
jgi:DNA segregation ATPase FtsK/SpoIIIE-like protein